MKFNCNICNQDIDNNKHIYRYKDTTYCSLCCIETVLLRDNNDELHKLLKSKIKKMVTISLMRKPEKSFP